MGYDMVRKRPNGSLYEIKTANDDNYFRLNIFGMMKVIDIALWGTGTHDGKFMMEKYIDGGPSNDVTGLKDLKEHLSKVIAPYPNEPDFIRAFRFNGESAEQSDCVMFAEALSMGLFKLSTDSVSVFDEEDIKLYNEFADWLLQSRNGVFVG